MLDQRAPLVRWSASGEPTPETRHGVQSSTKHIAGTSRESGDDLGLCDRWQLGAYKARGTGGAADGPRTPRGVIFTSRETSGWGGVKSSPVILVTSNHSKSRPN